MVAILTNKSAYDASIEVFCVNPYIYTNSGGRTIGRRGGGRGASGYVVKFLETFYEHYSWRPWPRACNVLATI